MGEPTEFKVGAIQYLKAKFIPEANQLPSGQAQGGRFSKVPKSRTRKAAAKYQSDPMIA